MHVILFVVVILIVIVVIDHRAITTDANRALYLYSVLRQVDLEGQQLPRIQVRVVGILKGFLQLLQLVTREDGPAVGSKACYTLTPWMTGIYTLDERRLRIG